MPPVIRTATVADAGHVAELLNELGYPQDAEVGDRLQRWIGDRTGRVLVASDGDELLGVLAMKVTARFERNGCWAQIVALVTSAPARGRGIGRQLVERAEAVARSVGCDTILVSSARERTQAHGFYKHLGYRDRCEDHAQFVRVLPQ